VQNFIPFDEVSKTNEVGVFIIIYCSWVFRQYQQNEDIWWMSCNLYKLNQCASIWGASLADNHNCHHLGLIRGAVGTDSLSISHPPPLPLPRDRPSREVKEPFPFCYVNIHLSIVLRGKNGIVGNNSDYILFGGPSKLLRTSKRIGLPSMMFSGFKPDNITTASASFSGVVQ